MAFNKLCRWLTRTLPAIGRGRTKPQRRRTSLLCLEQLEDRLAPATDITISHAVTTTGGAFALSGGAEVFTPTDATAIINDADINGFLNAGDSVTINTASALTNPGNITLDATAVVQKTAGTTLVTLTLNALGNIDVAGAVSGTTNPLTASLQAAGTNTQTGSLSVAVANLDLHGSSVSFGSATNASSTLAGVTTGGPFSFTNAANLTIGTVGGNSGIITSGGAVTITNTSGLTVSQAVSGAAGAVTLTGSGAINLNAAITGSSATVHGGTSADTIKVTITGATALALDGKGGGDSYEIDFGALSSPVNINATGTGTNTATVKGPTTADTFTVTGAQVTDNHSQQLTYTGVQQLTVNGGDAGNVFLAQGTASGVPTTLAAGGGDDHIYVSTSVGNSGTLSTLLGALSVEGGGGDNFLTVSEAGRTTADTVTVTGTAIASTDFTINYKTTGGSLSCVNFAGGKGGDMVKVQSTLASTPTGILNFGGDDHIDIGSNSTNNQGDLLGIKGPVGVLVVGGTTALTVSEAASATADMVTVNPTSIVGSNFTVSYVAIGGKFSGINFASGTGNDTVTVFGHPQGSPMKFFNFGGSDSTTVNVASTSAYNLGVESVTGSSTSPIGTLTVNDVSGGAAIPPTAPVSGTVQVLYPKTSGGLESRIFYTNLASVVHNVLGSV